MFISLNQILFIIFIIHISNLELSASSTTTTTTTTSTKKYNRFLSYIFNKYGNGGTITFEGLEHLMYNLGIGGLEFNPIHTIEEHHTNNYQDLFINDNSNENHGFIDTDAKKADKNLNMEQLTDTINYNHENDVQYGFKELHDPKHRHPRHHNNVDEGKTSNICLSPEAALKLVIDYDDIHDYKTYSRRERDVAIDATPQKQFIDTNKPSSTTSDDDYNQFLNIVKITPDTFMKLCPALLVQLDQHLCNEDDHHFIKTKTQPKPNSLLNAWIYASISIFILSSCGLVGVAMVPLMKSMAYKEILRFLVAVAVGTLAGDALMHLLPHALAHHKITDDTTNTTNSVTASSDDDQHNHNGPVLICACTFITITFMYCLENLLPLITGSTNGHHGHSHHHNPPITTTTESPLPQQQQQQQQNDSGVVVVVEVKEINTMLNETKKDQKTISAPMTPVAFMVILGDGLHNLTDGLAIGASFAADPVTGMATAFAVLCHELPHELGDFALLLQTGMSIRRAIYLNIVSSVLSFLGMAIGLLIVDLHTDMVKWIYACTAGSFLYIALADLVPEMGRNDGKNFKNTTIQIIGILSGGLIMLWIGLNEDRLTLLFQ